MKKEYRRYLSSFNKDLMKKDIFDTFYNSKRNDPSNFFDEKQGFIERFFESKKHSTNFPFFRSPAFLEEFGKSKISN